MEERGRLRAHFLMDAGDLGSRNMAVTWVDVPPGAEQRPHAHDEAEQVYVIVRGHGRMSVAGDEEEVGEGDLVFIPPSTQHGIVNDRLGDAGLRVGRIPAGVHGGAVRRRAGAGRGRLRRGRVATLPLLRCLESSRVPPTVGPMLEISRQQLVVYAAALVAVALIGARYLKAERDPPVAPERPRARRGGAQGRRAGLRARGRSRAAPGVYRLPSWERLSAAVRRAGGPAARADLQGVNLAAKVADGQQVVVPARVEGAAGAAAPAPGEDPTGRR